MATAVHIPVSEYLRNSYEPDCDYVDGEVVERHVGTKSHGILQFLLARWFDDRFDQYGCVAVPEQRLRVGDDRYRVPDVCVMLGAGAGEEVITSVPLVCIEVLSPDDTLPDLQERIDDYLALGVQNVWIFDPVKHAVWIASTGGIITPFTESLLPVVATNLIIDLPPVFAALERRLRA